MGLIVKSDVSAASLIIEFETEQSAAINCVGNTFPRFAARRIIPAQALPLKKYFGGMSLVTRTCDNEHTLASLGQSEVLGIKCSPAGGSRRSIDHASTRPSALEYDGVITADKPAQEAAKGVVGRRENSWDVFPNNEPWLDGVDDMKELQCEIAALIVERLSMSGHAERLARRAGGDEIDLVQIDRPVELREVAVVRNVGVVVFEHSRREWLDLRERDRLPAERLPCGGWSADARADGDVSHGFLSGHWKGIQWVQNSRTPSSV
jgi:hypothetical protein